MKHYIDKDAVVAEIERRRKEAELNCGGYKSYDEHRCDDCTVDFYNEFLEIINTLEVKEVDDSQNLEKEVAKGKKFSLGFFKSANANEFDVGDWLVHNERRNVIKVVNATPLDYEVVDVLGYHHTITDTAIENNYHLWTIQDAKDGDVLAFKDGTSGILLYKECTENFGVLSHCRIVRNSFIDKEESGWGLTLLSPATKEQRDLLFQKMYEAGYEWNADKKELKEIIDEKQIKKNLQDNRFRRMFEQKPTEWHREDEQNLNACLGYIPDEFLRRWLKDIIHVKYDKFVWSDEDERMLIDCFNIFHRSDYPIDKVSKAVEWLKSLKNRVLLHKSEWSRDDEQYLLVSKNALAKYQVSDKWDASIIYNWLKNKLQKL